MKKVFAGLAIASVMAACSSNTSNEAREAEIQQARQYTLDSMKLVTAQKEAEAKIAEQERNRSAARKTSSARNTTTYRSYSEPATTSSRDAHDRPGWSNKAKGAVVGGVVGAVTGAAVSKDKKARGAVIGGVVGAAGGYGVGAILDNKKKKNQ